MREFKHNDQCVDCYTSIKSRFPFIVPGGRFRESYYWDNYHIVQGLLVSEMYDTALGIAYNLLDLIKTYGFMPNGYPITINPKRENLLLKPISAPHHSSNS